MKAFQGSLSRRSGWGTQGGMTLTEIMVTMAVFSLVVIGLVYTGMFCFQLDQLANSKVGASDSARRGFDQLSADIRSSKMWFIGSGNISSFTPCGNATNQIGNALKVHATTSTNNYVVYYFDTNACTLCRYTNGMSTSSVIVTGLTNATGSSMSFHAERYDGTMLTDLQFKYVIVAVMEFCQYQYPLTKVGPNYFYNYYKLQFKLASHNFN
ncbi:MAG TPA: prepilin-type N-terminal cleavage/methylation domain-containing protein [Verrucomicrobiae bacterium]|nr:prepilin-type N-terminal cleavage/methylation domain-containing protein [Verrucomicrobiae bacterium]